MTRGNSTSRELRVLCSRHPGIIATPARTRVLLAVHALAAQRRPITGRVLSEELGISRTGIWNHLWALRAEGLVTWPANKAGCIQPTARFEPIGGGS